MSQQKIIVPVLTVDQLETGLMMLHESGPDQSLFWDEHVVAFRQTVIDAIGDTSAALQNPTIPSSWRTMLEEQLQELRHCVELADRYITLRQAPPRPERARLH
jgi:hypothetical protein